MRMKLRSAVGDDDSYDIGFACLANSLLQYLFVDNLFLGGLLLNLVSSEFF